nr:hyaluronan-mediated motility receptor-like [Megalopta genalis]
MAERLDETKNMLLKLEKKNSTQELEISQLEMINRELARQLEESKLEIAKSNNFLEAETIKYKDTLNEANVRIEELSNTVRTFEERRNNIEDKTELLEEEKARREAAEEEIRKLLEYNARLKKDHEEISEKYAELIGHQNHKQRIKHVSQLKDKITQLEMDLRKKTTKIEQQQKIIEKIRSEEKHVPNKFR